RYQHGQALADVAAAADQQLEGVVEHGRVGAAVINDGNQQRFVVRQPSTETTLPCAHPVDVALDRVDLAVVAEHAEWLSPLPGGRGIGAVTRVEDREGGDETRIDEVGI